nr:MAG TPA: hypothetical protein [Caudoviricetes sp.]
MFIPPGVKMAPAGSQRPYTGCSSYPHFPQGYPHTTKTSTRIHIIKKGWSRI